MLYLVSACFLTLICFSGPKIGSKQGPKSPLANSADSADRACHVIASFMRTRHSRFSLPRVRVVHASASLVLFQSARSREPCGRATANSFLPRGRVADAYASLLAGHLLNFLCSFHFCKLPSQSLTHSCTIKPETLNTQIMASNGNKRGLIISKFKTKEACFQS